jgi:hypothetical protein
MIRFHPTATKVSAKFAVRNSPPYQRYRNLFKPKKGAASFAAPFSVRIPSGCYLPFFGAFSSFLPFFFMASLPLASFSRELASPRPPSLLRIRVPDAGVKNNPRNTGKNRPRRAVMEHSNLGKSSGRWGRCRLLDLRRRNLAGVIAFAGLDVQTLALHTNLDGVVLGRRVGTARHVGEGVLVAGLFGQARVELLKAVLFRGVIDLASGMVRVADQR